ncbi:MAG TPA: response regulator [Leptospiraceae bacterium]|nr:response regulator [Leptospiraceae bacterium]
MDDTALNIELIKQFLKKNDVKVHSASSGEEAISLLESIHPHLIIMDLKMSGLDGFETTKIIKGNPATQNIPVLCYTASMMNTGSLDKYKIFNDFLGKPLIRADLLRALCRFLPFEKV